MGKFMFFVVVVVITAGFIFRNDLSRGLGVKFGGRSSVSSGVSSFGQSLGGTFEGFGNVFR